MTLHLELSPEEEARLHAKAVSVGLDDVSYIRSLINGRDDAKTEQRTVPLQSPNKHSIADIIEEIGTVEGLPADLSTNPQYMEGFGVTRDLRNFAA